MLAGCGGQASNGAMPGGVPDSSLPHHKTFNYTGGAQDFTVPAGVTHISVVARGAKGGGSNGAHGGRVHALIPVTPGEKLVVYVGGDGSGATGGFNGGGSSASTGSGGGKGGGGATDVREGGTSLRDRVIVSGGGGGAGSPIWSGAPRRAWATRIYFRILSIPWMTTTSPFFTGGSQPRTS
jgi:hypothetical protein